MIKVLRVDKDEFIVYHDSLTIYSVGNKEAAVDALYYLGVEHPEINLAFEAFDTKAHNTANFGVNKTLIYTERDYVLAKMTNKMVA